MPDRELQQLRDVEKKDALTDGQERQFISDILSALGGQFAANDALSECVSTSKCGIGGAIGLPRGSPQSF